MCEFRAAGKNPQDGKKQDETNGLTSPASGNNFAQYVQGGIVISKRLIVFRGSRSTVVSRGPKHPPFCQLAELDVTNQKWKEDDESQVNYLDASRRKVA